jgi:hypothetical protein
MYILQDDTTTNIVTIDQFPAATRSNESASDNEKFSMSSDTYFKAGTGYATPNLNSDQLNKFLVHFSQKTYHRAILNIYRKYILIHSNQFFLS